MLTLFSVLKDIMRKLIYVFLILLTFQSCEKGYIVENNADEKPQTDPVDPSDGGDSNLPKADSTTNKKDSIIDIQPKDTQSVIVKNDTSSVSAAIEKGTGWMLGVKGYIVGDCTKSSSNAEFTSPFTYTQSVLIADKKGETDLRKIMSVCLSGGVYMKRELNLVDNPTNYNRKLYVHGPTVKYLGLIGMKTVWDYILE